MATLTTQNISRAGITPTYAAAAGGGDAYTPGSYTFLHIKNGSGSPINAFPLVFAFMIGDVPLNNLLATIPAGGERMIGPLPRDYLTDPATGLGSITYDGVSSLTIAVLKLTPS